MIDAPVLIVGGGPVGLALAGDLGWRGLPCMLLEQSDGAIYQPKMDGVNVRTMEFCRRWGLVETIRNCPYPSYYPQDMVYLTSFGGYELGRETFTTPSGGPEEHRLGASPETRIRCPQNMFDPILRKFAGSFPHVDLRYRAKLQDLRQDADLVEATVQDIENGGEYKIKASYIVGCDGAASLVRELMGIALEGQGALTYTTNAIFRCADLIKLHDKQLGYRHIFIGPEGAFATLVAINGRDEWRVSIIGNGEPHLMEESEIRQVIQRIVGREFEFEILTTVPWIRRELVAASYVQGRAVIAGDAAHVMSPTGGFGMNTGIGDAVDLAWKLEALLKGWGGPGLLNSYEEERRPVGLRAAREASGNLLRTLSPGTNPALLDNTMEGALLRHEIGRKYSATMLREWYKLGMDLGYTYANSPIVCAEAQEPASRLPPTGHTIPPDGFLSDGTPITASLLREWQRLSVHLADGYDVKPSWTELRPDQVMIYNQSAAPGARAPHVWLADGRSTLDLFGKGFVLLCCVLETSKGPLDVLSSVQDAAKAKGVPLQIVECPEPGVFAAYKRRMTLVRPDGHVAWRSDELAEAEIGPILDRVRGAA